MACKLKQTQQIIEYLLTTAFILLSSHRRPFGTQLKRGVVGLLESIGLSYIPTEAGFNIVDEEHQNVIRIYTSTQPENITIYVEPAQLVLRMFEQYQIPIKNLEVNL